MARRAKYSRLANQSRTENISLAGELLPLDTGEVHLWRIRVAEFSKHICTMLNLLTVDERHYAHKFRNASARHQFVIGRAILRVLLSAYTGLSGSELRLRREHGGKLHLVSSHPVSFNVSHSNGLMLLAFARGREVGVDLEAILPTSSYQIAERIMPEVETQLLRRMPSSLARVRLTAMWSRMEACAKATGEGVASTLAIQRDNVGSTPPWCQANGLSADVSSPHIRSFRLDGHICSIASFGTNWFIRTFYLSATPTDSTQHPEHIRCCIQPDYSYEPI